MSANVRDELVRLMSATLADRQHWVYALRRPLFVPPTWHPGQRVYADCSKGVQYLCRWAGAPDPMLSGWSEWGNSTTLALNLPHVFAPAALRPGDIVTFGVNGGQHAAMVLEQGLDPLLWSHGHQGAPNTYRLSEDRREHQLLRIQVPDFSTPTPAALRARTGWFAWVAWRLAEGDWKEYGAANPKVRPDVPKLIPASWWQRLLVFLANRKKASPGSTL